MRAQTNSTEYLLELSIGTRTSSMSRITITSNLYAQIEGAVNLVDEALSYKVPGAMFQRRCITCHKRLRDHKGSRHSFEADPNGWDGTYHLLKRWQTGDFFPAGLVAYVCDYLSLRGRVPEVVDQRQRPAPSIVIFSSRLQIKLDPHQEKAVEEAIAAGRGVMYLPTGTGKTVIMGEVIRRLRQPTLVLCPTKVLLEQLRGELERLTGGPVGVIGDGRWEPGVLTVALYQSIARRLKPSGTPQNKAEAERRKADIAEAQAFLAQFRCVIADEGHHIEAATFEMIMRALPEAYHRYAFSATPFKSGEDGDKETLLRVQGWTGPVASFLSISGGVESGRIVPTDMFFLHLPYEADLTPLYGPDFVAPINYQEEVEQYIVRNPLRNQAIGRLAGRLRDVGLVCIITDRTAHGEFLHLALKAPFLHGGTPKKERERIFEDARAGRISCFIVSKVGDEGLDVPNIRFLILAAGGKAQHRQIQRIGRGMRASDDKTHLTAFDFADHLGKYLPEHAKSRRRLYARERAYTLTDITPAELEELLT